ncbi:DUF2806 domain-containing protein [Rhizobium sp. CIAT894]|uniref:DUF2806 domain-containing protein n=1 Tax=Rhizobium sp. CIAT894 TaxID=2020312 RepID=UPI0013DDB7D5|nr:DUF2806 domain-containing protein [Rhizobium sp. CIAT894]
MNVRIEGGTARRRSIIEGERALIEETVKYGIEHLKSDPQFAARAFETHFGTVARKQINRDEVLGYAVEDLKISPPTEIEAAAGPEELNQPFMDRLGSYAGEASTEELRQRWGRVLAEEVRNPGTFSNKVLRVVDEIDAATAKLFEDACDHRIGDSLPRCLTGELPYATVIALTTAGLLVEPGLGQHRGFSGSKSNTGEDFWLISFDDNALVISKDAKLPDQQFGGMADSSRAIFRNHTSFPATSVYILTKEGLAISSILPDKAREAFLRYAGLVREQMPEIELRICRRNVAGGYDVVQILEGSPPEQPSPGFSTAT